MFSGARVDLVADERSELQARAAGLRHEGDPRPAAAHRRQEEGPGARHHADGRQVSAPYSYIIFQSK